MVARPKAKAQPKKSMLSKTIFPRWRTTQNWPVYSRGRSTAFFCTPHVQRERPPSYGMRVIDSSKLEVVRRMYTSFFGLNGEVTDTVAIKGPLGCFRSYLLVDPYTNFFRNGAGKMLMYELLTLRVNHRFQVSVSTTTDPGYNWCGIYIEEYNISGVVDVLVRDSTGKALAVAELKRDGRSGLWQVVAAMETIALFSNDYW